MHISENIAALKKELAPVKATLVAVSKSHTNEMILEAYKSGQKIFAENYVQELEVKQKALPKDIEWHFIGHLQSNKLKQIIPFITLIQSVDSLKLLRDINKEAAKNNRVINCLLQVFIAEEETKYGFTIEEADSLLNSDEFMAMKNVCITGLMGMATNTADEKQIHEEFKTLKDFYEELNQLPETKNFVLQTLSMGMSSDYKIALQEGSNMVRIGSLIFGERIKKK